jgi:UDP-N-acetylglucosamine 2-epimerase (non-hydrolysing)
MAHAAAVASAFRSEAEGTGLIMVQGDTSSALGGALAGFAAGTPVAHVEAGLRSHDSALPWPEEPNRVAIDGQAALLFAVTEVSAANLRAEQVGGEIHVTGNTGVDALRLQLGRVPVPHLAAVQDKPRLLVTCHRRENWGDAFRPIAEALLELGATGRLSIDVLLPPNPAMAATMRERLSGCFSIRLQPATDHAGMIAAMRSASLILSDSGGVQEEAPALGVPLLVMREKTERPEGVTSGNMLLVGSSRPRIVDEVGRLLDDPDAYAAMAHPRLPYGDGHAADRIADLTLDWLSRHGRLPARHIA